MSVIRSIMLGRIFLRSEVGIGSLSHHFPGESMIIHHISLPDISLNSVISLSVFVSMK